MENNTLSWIIAPHSITPFEMSKKSLGDLGIFLDWSLDTNDALLRPIGKHLRRQPIVASTNDCCCQLFDNLNKTTCQDKNVGKPNVVIKGVITHSDKNVVVFSPVPGTEPDAGALFEDTHGVQDVVPLGLVWNT